MKEVIEFATNNIEPKCISWRRNFHEYPELSAQIINGLQAIISRQTELTKYPAVISTTIFQGGVRENIIPEEATIGGEMNAVTGAEDYSFFANKLPSVFFYLEVCLRILMLPLLRHIIPQNFLLMKEE